MASQSLYRKWRSQSFSDLIGQEPVVRTLLNAVREGRMAHAYLFCGPRGTGKTSTARLLAKAANCANPHDGEPCNECISCREIASGRSPDVIEIDAASHTGVDSIRELRETVGLMGSGGHYKLYIIDEVHMLSTAAFNALLKTLEEPPPHVIFVLATTEAHKVLPTIISRCQRFDFRRISVHDIIARLEYVAAGEDITLERPAAELLARAAQGGMRDALSLLDQTIASCGNVVDFERARTVLGLADPALIRGLIERVAERDAAGALNLIHDLVEAGADLRQVQQQLAEEWRGLMLARAGADVAHVMDRTAEEAAAITELASRFSLEALMTCARVFARDATPARGLPVPQLALEIAVLECVAAAQPGAAPIMAEAVQPRPRLAPATATPAPRESASPAVATAAPEPHMIAERPPARSVVVEELDLAAIDRGDAPPVAFGAPAASAPTPTRSSVPGSPSGVAFDEVPAAHASTPVVEAQSPTAGDSSEGGVSLDLARRQWALIKKVCKQKSPVVAALLNDAEPVAVEASSAGGPPIIVLGAKHSFHMEKLREPEKREMVEWSVSQVLERAARVRAVLATDVAAPAASSAAARPASAAPTTAPAASSAPPALAANGASSYASATQHADGQAQHSRASAATANPASATTASAAPASTPSSRPTAGPAPAQPQRDGPSGDVGRSPGTPTMPSEDDVLSDPIISDLLRSGELTLAEIRAADGGEDEQ